jgi:hypothetical protein
LFIVKYSGKSNDSRRLQRAILKLLSCASLPANLVKLPLTDGGKFKLPLPETSNKGSNFS